MVTIVRQLSSLAVLACLAAGDQRLRSGRTTGAYTIAGVPVLNYPAASKEGALGDRGNQEDWVLCVKSTTTDDEVEQMCRAAKGGCRLSGHPSQGGVPFLEIRGTEGDIEAVVKRGHGAVRYIEPDQVVYAIPEVTVENVDADLWGLERIGADRRSAVGDGVTVFVLDTGVRTTHEDFGGRGIPTLDTTSGVLAECHGATSCALDRDGHGTHCAGTAVGTTYGVAPGATLRSMKVLNDQGGGSLSWIYSALDWVATSSIRPAVASMSLGVNGAFRAMGDAVSSATGAGVIVVVAGGNSNSYGTSDSCNFSPAFAPSAITVGATTSLGAKSSFSNFGACVDMWAPGSSIVSAGYSNDTLAVTLSGTSMACPHVAGGAALVLQLNPTYNYSAVLDTLLASSRKASITGLYPSDTNSELYVGQDAPPPLGEVSDPVCEVETGYRCGPINRGICSSRRWCSRNEVCRGPSEYYWPYEQFSDNFKGVCDHHPGPFPTVPPDSRAALRRGSLGLLLGQLFLIGFMREAMET